MSTTTRLFTAEELFHLPENDRQYELIEGVLTEMPLRASSTETRRKPPPVCSGNTSAGTNSVKSSPLRQASNSRATRTQCSPRTFRSSGRRK
jgi:hypothetical protein